ncbi:hypothetical protein TNCV_1560671 [Trichonephila clavipes]|nr:hypothetical protein TNCV_1560671 [Trichonephila clavipes]
MSNEKHFSIASRSSFRALGTEDLRALPHWSIEIYNQKILGLSSAYPGLMLPPSVNGFLCPPSASRGGHGSSVVKVTGSLLVYHEFESVELLNLSRAPAGVVVRRGGVPAPRCRPHHLTMVQDYEVCRQKALCS